MFEAILQEGETIVMNDVGFYCGDGKTAAIKEGMLVLTNKRLLVLKTKAAEARRLLFLQPLWSVLLSSSHKPPAWPLVSSRPLY